MLAVFHWPLRPCVPLLGLGAESAVPHQVPWPLNGTDLSLAVRALHCCAGFFLAAVQGTTLLQRVASLCSDFHCCRAWAAVCRLRSCCMQAYFLHSMWNIVPRPRIEPLSPTWVGGFWPLDHREVPKSLVPSLTVGPSLPPPHSTTHPCMCLNLDICLNTGTPPRQCSALRDHWVQ